MNADIEQQVRSLLDRGYKIGTEHADKRRFRTSSWLSCPIIQGYSASQVIAELNNCLVEHRGEYVRLIGIDPKAKRRVLEMLIQKPDGSAPSASKSTFSASSSASRGSTTVSSTGTGGLSGEAVEQVRSLLSAGYRIGIEHADKRRFKTSSWLSGSPIQAKQEDRALAELEACLKDYEGEYVRLIGIDTKAKRRVLEMIIQQPDGNPSSASKSSASTSFAASSNGTGAGSIPSEVVEQVRSLLRAGYRIGSEHADKRRYKTSSWLSCPVIQSDNEAQVLSELQACLTDHAGEYVRLIGIDPKAKRRVLEMLIQRPGDTPTSAPTSATASSNGSYSADSNGASLNGSSNGFASSNLDTEAIDQVRSLIAQGYKISTEHANKRRFKTSSWQSGAPIESQRESEVIAQLEACLNAYPGEYVRLIGIDPNAKRRVAETLIQKPG